MKLIAAIIILIGSSVFAKSVAVKPYIKSDGKFVSASHRTAKNKTKLDNYSTKGNVNPYTGKRGTKNPKP